MPSSELEQVLGNLAKVGRLVKDRPYRQVWRFEHDHRPYYLKFYPFGGAKERLRRLVRGSSALLEFKRLQLLQKAGVPAPRAIALLMGFRIDQRKGDAVLLEGLEPSIQLDKHLNALELKAEDPPNHLEINRQIIDLLEKLGRAHLGHSDLHLGNLLLKDGKVFLLDGYAVHRKGLRLRDILLLGLSARPYSTKTDVLRTWKRLGPGGAPPIGNRRSWWIWRGLLERAFHNDRYFGHLEEGKWTGHFFKHAKFPHRWSSVSRMDIAAKDWEEAWPRVLQMMESGQFEVLKRTRSGEVLAGEVVLGGRPVPIIIKRPFYKYCYRRIIDPIRGTRPRRAWTKAWKLIIRNIPTAWPMLLMEKRMLGVTTDAIGIFERIGGKTLDSPQWAQRGAEEYQRLLFRAGRLLRRLEQSGLYLYDSKTTNWMVQDDPILGPTPMIIDMDGVRSFRQPSGGFSRLLRSLRENDRVPLSDDDALVLARGYAPFAASARLAEMIGSSAVSDGGGRAVSATTRTLGNSTPSVE